MLLLKAAEISTTQNLENEEIKSLKSEIQVFS